MINTFDIEVLFYQWYTFMAAQYIVVTLYKYVFQKYIEMHGAHTSMNYTMVIPCINFTLHKTVLYKIRL